MQLIAKTCANCGQSKPVDCFGLNKRARDGRKYGCKQCDADRSQRYRVLNESAYKASQETYRQRNVAARRKLSKEWYERNRQYVIDKAVERNRQNPEAARAVVRSWVIRNRDRCAAATARRNALRIKATPSWADEERINEQYRMADMLSALHGVPYQVDHIVPLNSPLVCGLHVHWNMQVMSSQENQSKSNRYWPGMWGQDV